MMKMRVAFVLMVAAAAGPWAMGQDDPAQLPPDVWVSDGDSDGDGLRDEFEVRQGLDPRQAISFADGTPDEDRVGSSGKTMWAAQASEQPSAPAEDGGAGGCGLLGIELVVLALLRGRGKMKES